MALPSPSSSSYSQFHAAIAPHADWLSMSAGLSWEGGRQSPEVLGNWSGTIWGRTGCTFNGSGLGLFATGDCGGEMECNGRNYTQPVYIGARCDHG
ncbi:G-type lectin S-receptor-like serine/threonine-protein kinase [Tanacetum coccineum]